MSVKWFTLGTTNLGADVRSVRTQHLSTFLDVRAEAHASFFSFLLSERPALSPMSPDVAQLSDNSFRCEV